MAPASAGNGGASGVSPRAMAVSAWSKAASAARRSAGGASPFVGEIVGGAREPVDRDDRGPQARRDEPRCDGKVLVMADGHAIRGE